MPRAGGSAKVDTSAVAPSDIDTVFSLRQSGAGKAAVGLCDVAKARRDGLARRLIDPLP
jgi:hypothetical protein